MDPGPEFSVHSTNSRNFGAFVLDTVRDTFDTQNEQHKQEQEQEQVEVRTAHDLR